MFLYQIVQEKVRKNGVFTGNGRVALRTPFSRVDALADATVTERVAALGDVRLLDQVETDGTQEIAVLFLIRRADCGTLPFRRPDGRTVRRYGRTAVGRCRTAATITTRRHVKPART